MATTATNISSTGAYASGYVLAAGTGGSFAIGYGHVPNIDSLFPNITLLAFVSYTGEEEWPSTKDPAVGHRLGPYKHFKLATEPDSIPNILITIQNTAGCATLVTDGHKHYYDAKVNEDVTGFTYGGEEKELTPHLKDFIDGCMKRCNDDQTSD